LLVTHQRHFLPLCDRVLVLRDGAVVALGTWTELAALGLPELRSDPPAEGETTVDKAPLCEGIPDAPHASEAIPHIGCPLADSEEPHASEPTCDVVLETGSAEIAASDPPPRGPDGHQGVADKPRSVGGVPDAPTVGDATKRAAAETQSGAADGALVRAEARQVSE